MITDTPTPTPSATASATNTVDPGSVWVYATLPADGQPVAIGYTFTAGEAAIVSTNLMIFMLLLFIVFILLVRRPAK